MANNTNLDTLMLKLFRFKKTAEYEGVTLYIRVVPDAVNESARDYAMRASRLLRRELRNKDSDAYLIHLDSLNDLTDEQLIVGNINLAMQAVMQEYMDANPYAIIPDLPDHATLEQQEEYQAAKDEREAVYVQDMQQHVDTWRADYEQLLRSQKREQLMQDLVSKRVDQITRELFIKEFENYVLANAVFIDDSYKTKLFATVDQFNQAPTDFKEFVSKTYNEMVLTSDELKK